MRTKLFKAIAEMTNPELDMDNPHFRSKYASLKSILKVTKPALAKHGLQDYLIHDGNTIQLWVTDGKEDAKICELQTLLGGRAQENGSELTYYGRYLRLMRYALVGDVDDDGSAAQAAKPKKAGRDFSELTDLKKRLAKAAGVSEATMGATIMERYGNPKDMSESAYQAMIAALKAELSKEESNGSD